MFGAVNTQPISEPLFIVTDLKELEVLLISNQATASSIGITENNGLFAEIQTGDAQVCVPRFMVCRFKAGLVPHNGFGNVGLSGNTFGNDDIHSVCQRHGEFGRIQEFRFRNAAPHNVNHSHIGKFLCTVQRQSAFAVVGREQPVAIVNALDG